MTGQSPDLSELLPSGCQANLELIATTGGLATGRLCTLAVDCEGGVNTGIQWSEQFGTDPWATKPEPPHDLTVACTALTKICNFCPARTQ